MVRASSIRNEATVEKGQAQEATRLRNEKLSALNDYAIELKAVAEIALEKQPQLLEKLGILVRSYIYDDVREKTSPGLPPAHQEMFTQIRRITV